MFAEVFTKQNIFIVFSCAVGNYSHSLYNTIPPCKQFQLNITFIIVALFICYCSTLCPRYRCKEPYPAQHVIELDLSVGDIVYVTKKREDGWFKGTLQRSGKTGLFPGSFVEKLD